MQTAGCQRRWRYLEYERTLNRNASNKYLPRGGGGLDKKDRFLVPNSVESSQHLDKVLSTFGLGVPSNLCKCTYFGRQRYS